MEAELNDKEINTPPLKRSAEFHIPSPELPLRKVNRLSDLVEESKMEETFTEPTAPVPDGHDVEKENNPPCNNQTHLVMSEDKETGDSTPSHSSPHSTESTLPTSIPVIKPSNIQSKLRQPTKRKLPEPVVITTIDASETK